MDEIQEEIISFSQFMRAIAEREMFASRVRVTFEFDVKCNSEPILNSGNDSDIKAHNLALLKSFLQTPQLLDMLIDHIGCELGLNSPESFMQRFLPQVSIECHTLFSTAIDALEGDAGLFWREVRDAPDNQWGDYLSLCTETIFECFTAEFVSSTYEVVEEQAMITWQDCLNKQDELIETIKLKMQQEPEHGKLWQEKLALMLCRRQEILIKAEQEQREMQA